MAFTECIRSAMSFTERVYEVYDVIRPIEFVRSAMPFIPSASRPIQCYPHKLDKNKTLRLIFAPLN